MELWELNACVAAYNDLKQSEGKNTIATCWQTANFTGAAFAGKLKKLSHYIKDAQKSSAPPISKDDFERKLAKAREGKNVTV